MAPTGVAASQPYKIQKTIVKFNRICCLSDNQPHTRKLTGLEYMSWVSVYMSLIPTTGTIGNVIKVKNEIGRLPTKETRKPTEFWDRVGRES